MIFQFSKDKYACNIEVYRVIHENLPKIRFHTSAFRKDGAH